MRAGWSEYAQAKIHSFFWAHKQNIESKHLKIYLHNFSC